MESHTPRPSSRILARLALAGGALTVLIGVLGLSGWIFRLPILTSYEPTFIPIALSTCIGFFVQGTVLLRLAGNSSRLRWFEAAPLAVTVIFGLLTCLGLFLKADLTLEGALVSSGEHLGRFPVNRMSPLTGFLFGISGLALLLPANSPGGKWISHVVCGLGATVGLIGLTGTLAYTYGAPLLYEGTVIPMALATSAGFMFLGAGLTAAAGPGAFLLKPLGGDSVRAMLLRTFVPLGFLAVIGSNTLQHLVKRSDSVFVSAVSAIFFGIITVVVVVHAARKLGNTVDRAREERRRVEDALMESEGRFKAIFDNAKDGILLADMESGKFYMGNPAICEMLGYSWDELKDLAVPDIHPRKDLILAREQFERQSKGLTRIAHDIPVLRKDGRVLLTDINAFPIFLADEKYMLGIFRDVTERTEVESALRESEARYKELADSIADVFFALDPRLRYTYWNRASEELTGIPAEEALGKSLYELFPDVAGTRLERSYLEALEASEPRHAIDQQSIGGRELFFELSIYPCRTGLSVFARDITQRKWSEDALRESRNLLAKAQEIAHIGHWKLDPKTNVVEGSEELFRIFNLNMEELDFRAFVEVVRPDQRDFVVNVIRDAITQRRGYDIEHWLICRNGAHKYIRAIGEPLLDDQGSLTVMVGTVQDITDRKRAEEERAKMATVIEQAADGIFITDKIGNIEYVNPAFERISGYERRELVGRSFGMFREVEPEEGFYRNIWNTVSRGNTWSGRLVNRMKHDRICEFDTTISPIRDSSEMVIGYVSVNRDVTQEARLERQLRHAQKMEAVGTLAGGIAHDFNNILGIIMGYTEITLLDVEERSPVRHGLQEILTASRRARDLVQQILAFSRKGEQERIPLRVRSIVKEALKFLRPALPSTIEIRQQLDELPHDADIVIADPTQVHQVLMNLCTNAAHAMREEGGVLEVGLSLVAFGEHDFARPTELGPGSYVRLSVSDTGPGMDRSVLERIFEPYFTTKGPGEGTGLGLAVVHGIVTSHGGAITAYSSPGEGSAFHVYLPATTGRAASREEPSQPLATGSEAILFVDDEVPLAETGKRMLEMLGYRVQSKTSGEEALEAFRAEPEAFDLVISDMTMPRMTGLDLAREILALRPEMPIIVCTGYSSIATPERIRDAGIQKLLLKPLILHEMAKTVREVLDERRSEALSSPTGR